MTDQTPQTTTEPVLLPCPFCGGEADRMAAMGESWVRCMTCNAATEMFGTDTAAIAAWNRRSAPAKPAEVPFTAEDACLACNSSTPPSVDWNVAGPKLVEAASWAEKALERYVDALGLDQADDAALIALYKTTDALAAAMEIATPAQPETGDVAALREALEALIKADKDLAVAVNFCEPTKRLDALAVAEGESRAARNNALAALSKPNTPGREG